MNLETSYLGLRLDHPLVASASPLSRTLDGIRQMEDGGASAIVMFSLFEEQLRREREALDHLSETVGDSHGEAQSYFPAAVDYATGPVEYLELLRRAVEAVDVPVIGSLNGVSETGWTDYARQIEDAGAAALELNVYLLPTEMDLPGSSVERRYLRIVRTVCESVDIPVAVKIGPYFSSPGHMIAQIVEAGAAGVVLFNRFYQPDFDLEQMSVEPGLELSSSYEMRLPLLWIAVCFGRFDASIAATTGVQTGIDAAKYLLAGADAVMATSSVLRHGPRHFGAMRDELERWMTQREYQSVEQIKGAMSRLRVAEPGRFERANYIRTLQSA